MFEKAKIYLTLIGMSLSAQYVSSYAFCPPRLIKRPVGKTKKPFPKCNLNISIQSQVLSISIQKSITYVTFNAISKNFSLIALLHTLHRKASIYSSTYNKTLEEQQVERFKHPRKTNVYWSPLSKCYFTPDSRNKSIGIRTGSNYFHMQYYIKKVTLIGMIPTEI